MTDTKIPKPAFSGKRTISSSNLSEPSCSRILLPSSLKRPKLERELTNIGTAQNAMIKRKNLRRSKSFAIAPLKPNVVSTDSRTLLSNINKRPILKRQLSNINTAQSSLTNRNILRRSKSFAAVRAPVKSNVQNVFKKPVSTIKHGGVKNTVTSNAESNASKQTKIKIAPYDYKARYNDLLNKHTALKSKYGVNEEKLKCLEEEHINCGDNLSSISMKLENIENSHGILKTDHSELKNKFCTINTELSNLKLQYSALEKTHSDTLLALKETEEKKLEYCEKLAQLTTENKLLSSTIKELELEEDILKKANKEFQNSLQSCYDQRKVLHNTILELKGNIRVFCRLRPTLPAEKDQNVCLWNFLDEFSLEVTKENDISGSVNNKVTKQEFTFDKVFTPYSSQEEIFNEVELLIQSAIDGYNVCIFAYGQTGSGKTYTMEGSQNDAGLIPRSVEYIFDKIQNLKTLGWSFEITTSFLEIYNEHIRDLLNPITRDLEIRLVNAKEKNVYVTNLQEVIVRSEDELKNLLQQAQRNRVTAQTEGNERSSRSHLVSKITISSSNSVTGQNFNGVLNLVDLAGSESPKNSIRMEETKNINKSLAQLGKVILSLQQKQDHIPYRSSKLTYLLMPSLGGSSKTLMFVNINPLCTNYNESINSLRFASQVNQVKTLRACKNRSVLTAKQIK